MKDVFTQTKNTGRYEEDMYWTIETFEKYASMCDMKYQLLRKELPVMLSGNSFSLLKNNSVAGESYTESISTLWTLFNSREKQTGLLADWKGMRISATFQANRDDSELSPHHSFFRR